jgi:hypothetical protein
MTDEELEIEPEDEYEPNLWDEIEEAEVAIAGKAASIVLLFLASILVLLLAAAVVGVVYRVATTGPIDANLNPLNMIFASRVIVGAARLSLLFVAAYVIFSCIGLISERRWLVSLWPPKASEPVAKSVKAVVEDRDSLLGALGEAYQQIEGLQQTNEALVAEITELGEAHDQILDYVSTITSEEEDASGDA